MPDEKPEGSASQVSHRTFPRISYLKYRDPFSQERVTVAIELPGKFGMFRHKPIVADLQNISRGGCAFVCQHKFEVGSLLNLRFGEDLRHQAVVRWVDVFSSGDVITGVQFSPVLTRNQFRKL